MMPWDISMRKALSEVLSGINQMLLSGYAPHDYSPEHILSDAKSYLTDYKELANDSAEFAEWKENPPLTWDELKGMVGKPVWVETEKFGNHWYLIEDINEMKVEFVGVYHEMIQFYRGDFNTLWNAYRKEN